LSENNKKKMKKIFKKTFLKAPEEKIRGTLCKNEELKTRLK